MTLLQRPSVLLVAVVHLYIATNFGMLAWKGVRLGADSPAYIDGAARLLEGHALDRHHIAHAGYIVTLAVFQQAGAGATAIVVTQILLAGFAIVVIYRIGSALAGPFAGLVAASLLACDIESARWHAFLLTDSLYMSAVVLSAWYVPRVGASGAREWSGVFGGVASVAAAALLRPEGWLLIPLALAYWVIAARVRHVGFITGLAGVFCGALLLVGTVPRARATLDELLPVEPFASGQTIWGSDRWTVVMPVDADPELNHRGVSSAFRYTAAHPAKTSALMLSRAFVHFGHIRPFYSLAHNLAILIWLVPIYIMALHGWWTVARCPLAVWSLAVLGAHTAVMAATHADWDGRYLAHVLPLIYVFSACGVASVGRRLIAGYLDENTMQFVS